MGDSAGGNLAVGVTLHAIHKQFRKPDALVLCYPMLNLCPASFSPSHLLALHDLVLPHSLLRMCMRLYAGRSDPTRDPYLSSMAIGLLDLRFFPRVRIMAAGRDPLRDDSFKFALRLL